MTVKLIQGDCLEEMQKLIDDGVKVDMVLTDPPYGVLNAKWDYIIPLEQMWECINKISKENISTKWLIQKRNNYRYIA